MTYEESLSYDRVGDTCLQDDWEHITRPRLISHLLRDRSVLRVIRGPAGFGKSALVDEYARTVFDDIGVVRIDGTNPSFICMLDKGMSLGQGLFAESPPLLIVIDDLPLLDDARMRVVCQMLV